MNLPLWPRSALIACGALALLALLLLIWPSGRPADPFADSARFQAAVGQALRANPELVVEALQAMQARQGP